MKKLIGTMTAAAMLVIVAAVPAAAAVERYQVVTNAYTLHVNNEQVYDHAVTVVINPCDGSVVGTGTHNEGAGLEEITGSFEDGLITFRSEYVPGPYGWGGTFPVGGGVFTDIEPGSGVFAASAELESTSSTTYKNHGAYVQAMGGGADAAHSCIGKPVQARS